MASHHIRLFRPQFVDKILRGSKFTTIRAVPVRPIQAGDRLELRMWTGKPYRSKQVTFATTTVKSVKGIRLYHGGATVDDTMLTASQWYALALADGFDGTAEMQKWFEREHGLPFAGILITWTKII